MEPVRTPLEFFSQSLDWKKVCITVDQNNSGRCDIGPEAIINILLPNVIILAGLIFFVLIIYYGWRLLQHAGSDTGPQQLQKAQQALSYSLIGFIVVVTSFFILQAISYITGINFLNLNKL